MTAGCRFEVDPRAEQLKEGARRRQAHRHPTPG